MTSGRCTEEQVIGILKEAEGGLKVCDLCRQNGISEATYYRWKSKYGGMEVSDIRQGAAKAKSSRVRRKTVSRLHTGGPSALAALALGWSWPRCSPVHLHRMLETRRLLLPLR